MVIRFLSASLASFIGIYIWMIILNILDPIYNFNEAVFGFMIYYAPLMFLLISITKCIIYLVKCSEVAKRFLKSEGGLFLMLLVPVSLCIPLKNMITNGYDFKISFLVGYLISMQVYFLLRKIPNRYFKA